MRKLHLVGFTPDHGGLVFAAREGAKSGSYVVTVDADLIDCVDRARRLQANAGARRAGRSSPRGPVESALSPREIQARLRAGRTLDEVADEAGVAVEWVERFAAPIFAEQEHAVALAGGLTVRSSRRGESAVPLRASLRHNLADRGVHMLDDEMDAGWSAYQLAGSQWVIRFEFRDQGRPLQAEWSLDLSTHSVIDRNALAAELGYVSSDGDRPELPAPRPPVAPVSETGQDSLPLGAVDPAAGSRARPQARRPRSSVRTGDGSSRPG